MKKINENPAMKKAFNFFVFSLTLLISTHLNAANYYWVGGSGNWIDFANHWATSSGGATFHVQPPTINDDIYFDDNSFSFSGTDTVFIFSPTTPTCNNFSFINNLPIPRGGFASSTIGGSGITFLIKGNLGITGPIANYSFSNNDVLLFSFWSAQAVQYIQTSGNRMNIDLYSSNTATYNLLDDLDGSFLVRSGRLNTNGHSLNITSFLSRVEYQGIIDFGNSIINSFVDPFNSFEVCCGGRIIADNATFNLPVTSFVHNNNTTASATVKEITAKNIYVINDTIGVCNITGIAKSVSSTINDLNLNGSSAVFYNDTSALSGTNNHIGKFVMNADTCSIDGFLAGMTTLIDTLIVNTSCKNVILKNGYNTNITSELDINTTPAFTTIKSDVAGIPAILTKNNGTLCFDYLSIKDVTATGGAQFFAGANSVNSGGNAGWNFASCPPQPIAYYWVGGTGNWSDFANHWATTSGGATFHVQTPTLNDDVYFDGSSFSGSGQTITINSSQAFCKDFNWVSTIPDTRVLASLPGNELIIHGSVFIDNSADFDFDGKISLGASFNSCTISIADTLFADMELYNNAGVWDLTNNIISRRDIKLVSGFFNTNGYDVYCQALRAQIISTGLINLGNSTIYFKEFDNQNHVGPYGWFSNALAYVIADSATFIYQTLPVANATYSAGSYGFDSGSNNKYGKIVFNGSTSGVNFPTLQTLNIGGSFYMNIGSIEANNVNLDINNISNLTIDTIISTALTTKNLLFSNVDTILIEKLSCNQNTNFAIGVPLLSNIHVKDMTVKNLIAGSQVTLNRPTFDNVIITNSCLLGGIIAHKINIQGDGSFNNYCTFDTLMLTAGHNYEVGAGDSIVINNNFIAFGNAGNLIQLNSAVLGAQANIHFIQGNVCSDYLSLRDMNAIGTNINAGLNSINLANNTGWLFTPCSIVSDVWPGDANYDLMVSNFDILNLGLAYNETGPLRAGASIAYVAQPATDWNGYFQTAVNKKHADTNGDGIVDDNDTTAISLNYGLTHPARMASNQNLASPNDPYLYLEVNPDSANLSDTIYIETFYGTSQTPVDSVYGIAFTINYDTTLVDTSWISTEFLNSWFGQPGTDLLTFSKSMPLEQKIDIAMVRTDHNNASGFGGPLCRTGIVIVDNVAGRMPLPFTISDPYALTASEFELGVNLGNDTVLVDTTALGIGHIKMEHFTIAPNPAKDLVVLKNIPAQSFVTIYNVQGELIFNTQATGVPVVIDTRLYSKGIYTIRVNDTNQMAIGKLIKL